jgi:hypothetical protein
MSEDRLRTVMQRIDAAAVEHGALLRTRCTLGPLRSEWYVLSYESLIGAGEIFRTSDFADWVQVVRLAIRAFRRGRERHLVGAV